MNQKSRLIIFTLLIIVAVIVVTVTLLALWSSKLELERITVTADSLPSEFRGYRIAQISDLHNAEFGKDNGELLALLREADPDIIAITGDMIDSRSPGVDVALKLACEMMKIAPCYYVSGNHELRLPSEYRELKAGLRALGVTVLSNEKLTLEKNGARLSVIGVEDPSGEAERSSLKEAEVIGRHLENLLEPTDSYRILLSHRPELFEVYARYDVDLALCGHAHGGQFRFWDKGLIAPNQGLFPKYDSGLYTSAHTNMVVSRGIGNSIFPFRINNRPQIVLIELWD